MTYKFNHNIRVYYGPESKEKSFLERVVQKGAEAINDTGAFIGLLRSKLIAADSKSAIDKIILEEKNNLNKNQIETIYALYETGEIGRNQVGASINRGGKKSHAISEAIDRSKNEPHILVYSNEEYRIVSVQAYKNDTDGKPENLNVNIVQGILKTATQTNDSRIYDKYLTRRTLQDLAIYLQGRGYNSRLIPEGINVRSMMEALAKEKIDNEKAKIDPLIKEIRDKFGKNPQLAKSLELIGKNYGIPINGAGDIQFEDYIKTFFIEGKGSNGKKTDIQDLGEKTKGINEGISKMILSIKAERESLIQKIGGKNASLKDLKILGGKDVIVKDSNGKDINIKNVSLLTLSKSQAQQALIQISEKIGSNSIDSETINYIIFLSLHAKLSEAQGVLAQGKVAENTIKDKDFKVSVDKNGKPLIQFPLKTEAKLLSVKRTAEVAQSINDIQSIVGNITPDGATEKLKTLDPNSTEAINLKQYLSRNAEAVSIYRNASNNFGEETAQQIFTENFREITGNKTLIINSEKALKYAIITDPESTIGEKSLAQLEPGKSISIQKALTGDMDSSILNTPEISSLGTLSMNQNGTYNIPGINQRNLTEPQLKECLIDIKNYAELGLSQFIPHLTIIGSELRKKGINTKVDGNSGTMEQQQALKSLYSQLFGKNIETTNLGDVQRAFASALGNPTNMRNAMQHVLKTHNLISESGGSIDTERLQKWFQENNTDPLLNLT